ncbi:MAG: response regulator [Rubripirellula sp.]|nr:response regulator [Rubripirellula sp.]
MAKVLLVEDSPTQAVEIRMLLEEGAHTVKHVGNGRQAIKALGQESLDLVVTGLEMPEMNGLELVEAMKVDFPHIPAVLVTAQGSEELASKALQTGAAGYVPKHHLQTMLNDTVIDVLGVIRTDASFSNLISTLQKNQFVFDLPSDAELISPLVGLMMQVIAGMELLSGSELVRIGVAIEHAMVNAMYRGNLELGPSVTPRHRALVYDGATSNLIQQRQSSEPYQKRRVYVDATVTRDEIRISIRDEGKGFDTSSVPKPSDQKNLNDETGQGLVLMASFTDEMIFNDQGNEVTLVKRCSAN